LLPLLLQPVKGCIYVILTIGLLASHPEGKSFIKINFNSI
jgi:hypothetical protein